MKESEKKDKYLDITKETVEHERDNYTIIIIIGALGTGTKGLIKGNRGLGNNRTNGDHLNYCIIEIDQNTEKSPGDSRRLAVTQTPVKDHKLTLMCKFLKE